MTIGMWGQAWPATITLEDAADKMDFDLFEGDDLGQVLTRGWMPIVDLPVYSVDELAANDAEDRFTSIAGAMEDEDPDLPPIVVLPGDGMRDGAHRVALAVVRGVEYIPAYGPDAVTLAALCGHRRCGVAIMLQPDDDGTAMVWRHVEPGRRDGHEVTVRPGSVATADRWDCTTAHAGRHMSLTVAGV